MPIMNFKEFLLTETKSEIVTLQQDGREKLKVEINRKDIESDIKSVTKWKDSGKHETLLARLYSVGSSEFNDVVEKLHKKYNK